MWDNIHHICWCKICTIIYVSMYCIYSSIHHPCDFSQDKSKILPLGHSLLVHTSLAHIKSHESFFNPYMELGAGQKGGNSMRKDRHSWASSGGFTLQETVEERDRDDRVIDLVVILMGMYGPDVTGCRFWCILVHSHHIWLRFSFSNSVMELFLGRGKWESLMDLSVFKTSPVGV